MSGLSSSQARALEASGCEVRTDDLSRTLYATDASIYEVHPLAVGFPRSADETSALFRAAADSHMTIIPRGAGSGLTGGALGDGLVVDLARHNRHIDQLDLDRRTVRVGAGVVLDQLNGFLHQYGLWFGPDVATSSRATLGGMIGNNSSGAYARVYGTTMDHVEFLEVVLGDGTMAQVGKGCDDLPAVRDAVDEAIAGYAGAIDERLGDHLIKQWSGYAFDQALRRPGDLTRLICGSEGTLAAVTSATLNIVPRPQSRGLGVAFFDSISEGMIAAVELLGLEPAAVEHADRILLDQTRGQAPFARARSLLGLDEYPCESMLLVEFFDEDVERLDEFSQSKLGTRRLVVQDPVEQSLVWGVRKAGLSLLTGCRGSKKPTTCIEDVCVRAEQIPDYVAGLQEILGRLGLAASFYGHAASGELHVRPTLDLHQPEDLAKLRRVSDEVSDLCLRFGGSLAAEHGIGIARTEYLSQHLGPELMEATRRIKDLFDPRGVMNTGKIIDTGVFHIDRDLRLGEGSLIDLPFEQQFGWVHKDGSFLGNLEQCNGCGGCRKDTPSMCPTFIASGEEIMSTRGRANTIRAALIGGFGGDGLTSSELDSALTNCLSCKACRTECPSNVDLASLKAELIHARHRSHGIPFRDRLIAAADGLGRLGTMMPAAANVVLGWSGSRAVLGSVLGMDPDRRLPPYTGQRFDRWFNGRRSGASAKRGPVILWDDTWVRYHEPDVGRAAVSVLEAAGYEVSLARGRKCCGRPATSRGLLDEAHRLGEHNVSLLLDLEPSSAPVVFLEPSCYSMFVDEYLQFEIPGADRVAARCVLFEELIGGLLDSETEAIRFRDDRVPVAIHGHCHAKALGDAAGLPQLAERIPGVAAELLDVGCCGMAGAFGMLQETAGLSKSVAAPLVEAIESLPPGTRVVASGTSCRHQIADLTDAEPVHMAELLAEHLRRADSM